MQLAMKQLIQLTRNDPVGSIGAHTL